MRIEKHEEERSESGSQTNGTAQENDSKALRQGPIVSMPSEFFQSATRLINAKDILLLAALPALAAVAWTCSDALCLKLARKISQQVHRVQPQRYREYDEIFREFLPSGQQLNTSSSLSVEATALLHLERFQLLRYCRPGSWHPRTTVSGKEHLDNALAHGKGAILWVAPATFSNIISKVALRAQGYDVWHLGTNNRSNLSSTLFGFRFFLNRIRIAIERRYLAGRIEIDPADPIAAIRRLEHLLAENQIVSIPVGAMARRLSFAPFGQEQLPLAGGPPSLALMTSAPLIPLFTERKPDGSFVVTIEQPLEAPTNLSRIQKIYHLIVRQNRLLHSYFELLPAQFTYSELHRVRRILLDASYHLLDQANSRIEDLRKKLDGSLAPLNKY